MSTVFSALIRDETGTALMEYGLLIAGVSLVALVSVHSLGKSVSALFNSGPPSFIAGPRLP